MNKEVKEKWVAALLSGDYDQTGGALRRGADKVFRERFCCLGVLCDLYAKEQGERGRHYWEPFPGGPYKFGDSEVYPPLFVLQWAGLGKRPPAAIVPDNPDHEERMVDYGALAGWNDRGEDFAEIAKLIRAHL